MGVEAPASGAPPSAHARPPVTQCICTYSHPRVNLPAYYMQSAYASTGLQLLLDAHGECRRRARDAVQLLAHRLVDARQRVEEEAMVGRQRVDVLATPVVVEGHGILIRSRLHVVSESSE